MEDDIQPDIETPTALPNTLPPSIHHEPLINGTSYTHFSPVPSLLATSPNTECVLGVDEAGRGPVLGPMVYGLFYLPITLSTPLLKETHHFDDSKVLTPAVRASLFNSLYTPFSDLHDSCGWAVNVMSARTISSNMMKPNSTYNLNAQAMDATIALIQGVYDKGVSIKEIYIDTIGDPMTYQRKLERVFPNAIITVAKKADSLYPCVSAASVCAKVTRDVAMEVLYKAYVSESIAETENAKDTNGDTNMEIDNTKARASLTEKDEDSWGSGYPSDVRCTSWMKRNMDPVFGWGAECRFSWGTVKDLLDAKNASAKVVWPATDGDGENSKLTDWFGDGPQKGLGEEEELASWYGTKVGEGVF